MCSFEVLQRLTSEKWITISESSVGKNHPETEMQPLLVSYPLELIHLDILTLGRSADNNRQSRQKTNTNK